MAGTEIVADIRPGDEGSDPASLVNVGGMLYFTADDGVHGRELWRSDGTAQGTVLIGDVAPGTVGSSPLEVVAVGDDVYWSAFDVVHGRELWRSDGTAQSAVRVADIVVGAAGSNPTELTAVGDRLFFTADNGVAGRELWTTDGTEAGTALVRDIVPGAAGSMPRELTAFEGALFFTTVDEHLWRSQGTAATTEIVIELPNSTQTMNLASFVVAGDRLHFKEGANTLWQSGGEASNTTNVRTHDGSIRSFTVVDSVLFYVNKTGESDTVWRSDGTQDGTFAVTSGDGAVYELASYNGQLFFGGRFVDSFRGDKFGVELYRIDGTEPSLVIDLDPDFTCQAHEYGIEYCIGGSSFPGEFAVAAGRLFFATGVTNPGLQTYDSFYVTDGTEADTKLLAMLSKTKTESSTIDSYFDFNGTLLWTIAYESQYGGPYPSTFWKTYNGIDHATKLPLDPPVQVEGAPFKRSDGTLFFFGITGEGTSGLWRATAAGQTHLIKEDIRLQRGFYEFDGIVYFDAVENEDLLFWQSDGTEAGTHPVYTIDANPCLTNVTTQLALYMGNGLFYCSLHRGTRGDALWRSDGTPEGTVMLSDYRADIEFTNIETMRFIDGVLYYTLRSLDVYELWRSDGTREGTYRLHRFNVYDEYPLFLPLVSSLAPLGDQVIFLAEYENIQELWTTDSTVGGTQRLRSFTKPPNMGQFEIARLGDRVLFAAEDESGRELWTTDGTPEGTARLKDINPGAGSASPTNMTVIDDLLLFSADDAEHGAELWISDGTAEGTTLVQDLYPGFDGSEPAQFIRSGQHLYFVARHPVFGRELWSVPYRFEVRSRVFLPLIRQTAR
jgi:large repetitive protein